MNPFDAAVAVFLLVAIVTGLWAGLLRSLATMFGYLAATGIAVAVEPKIAPLVGDKLTLPSNQNGMLLFVLILVIGFVLSAILRMTISEISGAHIGFLDRALGAMLGAVRIALLAVVMVLIFERLIPPGREPAFLAESQLRPILSAAGQHGLRSLPPDVTAYIDRLKKERGL